MFDKIQMTQMVVFNRFKGEFEKLDFHKVVRGISRRPDLQKPCSVVFDHDALNLVFLRKSFKVLQRELLRAFQSYFRYVFYVEIISRRPDIVYEYIGGKAEFDEIEDPMPFDVNAPVIEIEDRDFKTWTRRKRS